MLPADRLQQREAAADQAAVAARVWELLLAKRWSLLPRWQAFLKEHHLDNEQQPRPISRDTWALLLEFATNVNADMTRYDPLEAWPVLIDDFVDFVNA